MKKILKKSLACMLAAILCLTACVGAMATVGAEGAITYAITDVTVNQGEEAVIDVVISNFADVAGLIAEITVPDAVESIDSVKLNDTVELVAIGETAGHYIVDGKTVKFVGLFNSLNEFGDAFATVDALEINIAVTIADDAEGEYPFAAPVFQAGTELEELLGVNGTVGKLTVKAVCTHAETKEVVVEETAATCTADGSKTISVRCAACDVEISTRTEVIPATGHAYDDGVVTTEPDCENAGVKTFTCANCGHTYTEVVDALGHDWNEGEVTTAPDCDDAGVKTYTCANDPSHTKEEAIDALGHTAAAETVKKDEVAATCTTAGSYRDVVVCAVCGAEISSETITVDALGHKEVDVDAVPPTCTETGLTAGKKCSVCGVFTVPQETVDATGIHEYEDLVCECGAKKAENEALFDALYSTNMSIGDKFGIYRCFWIQNIKDTSIVYDDFEVVVTKKALDGSTFLYKEEEIAVFDETNYTGNSRPDRDFYYYNYNQVSLYELGVDITYTLYLYKDGEKIEYYTFDPITFVSVAKAHYDKYLPSVTTNLSQVQMGASLLNVAANAQNYFKDGKPESPLNTFANPLEGVDEQYIADYSTLTAIESPTQDSTLSLRGLQLLATPSLRYWYYNSNSTEASKVTLTATYTSLNPKMGENGTVAKTLNGANLPGSDGSSANRGLYYFTFDQIALYDGNKVVTLTATDETGTYTFETSLDTFLVNNINVTTLAGDVYRAIASLSACTRIYFPEF